MPRDEGTRSLQFGCKVSLYLYCISFRLYFMVFLEVFGVYYNLSPLGLLSTCESTAN
jgi:hypothetical protein